MDTASGMNFLHLHNPQAIIHRGEDAGWLCLAALKVSKRFWSDLKSPNLLLDATLRVKVCDFGNCKPSRQSNMSYNHLLPRSCSKGIVQHNDRAG